MENEARCPAAPDPAAPTAEPTVEPSTEPTALPTGGRADADPAQAAPIGRVPHVDWLTAQAELDDCDGYVVLAVDPQTGEVDATARSSGSTPCRPPRRCAGPSTARSSTTSWCASCAGTGAGAA